MLTQAGTYVVVMPVITPAAASAGPCFDSCHNRQRTTATGGLRLAIRAHWTNSVFAVKAAGLRCGTIETRCTRNGGASRSMHAGCLYYAALRPEEAVARRPYDLRHAALSLWLNASSAPAEIAARAGNSTRVLHDVYAHCIDSQEDRVSQQIEDALDAGTGISIRHRR